MHKRSDLIAIATLALFVCYSRAQYPKVPCPDIFQYESSDGLNFGKLALDLGFGITTLEVELSQAALSNPAFTEKVDLDIDINDIYNYIEKDKAVPLKVRFQYPNVIPVVTAVRVNGAVICSGPKIPTTLSSRVNFKGTLTIATRNSTGSSNTTIDKNYDSENQLLAELANSTTLLNTSSAAATTTSPTTTPTSTLLPGFLKVLQKATTAAATTTAIPALTTTTSPPLPPFLKMLHRRSNTPTKTTTKSLVHDVLEISPSAEPESILADDPVFISSSTTLLNISPTVKTTAISPTKTSSTKESTTVPISTTLPGFLKLLRHRSNSPTTRTARSLSHGDLENVQSAVQTHDPRFMARSTTLSTMPMMKISSTTIPTSTSLPGFLKVLQKPTRKLPSIPKTTTPPITSRSLASDSLENTLPYEAETIPQHESRFITSFSRSLSNTSTTAATFTISPITTSLTTTTPTSYSLPGFLQVLQKATTIPSTTMTTSTTIPSTTMTTSAALASFFKILRRRSNTPTTTTARVSASDDLEILLSSEPQSSTILYNTSTTTTAATTTTTSPSTTSSTTSTSASTLLPGFLKVLRRHSSTPAKSMEDDDSERPLSSVLSSIIVSNTPTTTAIETSTPTTTTTAIYIPNFLKVLQKVTPTAAATTTVDVDIVLSELQLVPSVP